MRADPVHILSSMLAGKVTVTESACVSACSDPPTHIRAETVSSPLDDHVTYRHFLEITFFVEIALNIRL